jgi:CheY-like chemotaxis protein
MSRPLRVLVVDDEADVRDMIVDVLEIEGYEVVTAADGGSALEAVRSAPVDLVTLDLRMPGMDSKEALAELRRMNPGAPVIVISGYASPEEAEACLALGAFAVVRKPFALTDLLDVLAQALAAGAPTLNTT